MEKIPPETSGSYQDVSDKLSFLALRSIGIPGYNEEEREALTAFYNDDPYGIIAAYNSRWNASDVVQSVRSLSDRDRFYAMKSLMDADIKAQSLIGQANYYIAVSNVLEIECGGQNPGAMSEEQCSQVASVAIDLHDSGDGFNLPPWDRVAKSPTNLDEAAIDKLYRSSPDYVKTAFEFADYENAVTIGMLNYHIQNEIRDYDAQDVVTGQPAFLNASTYSEYQRLTRPLPTTIQYWYEHGLLDMESYITNAAPGTFIFDWQGMERVASIVLPEGVEEETFKAYKEQVTILQNMPERARVLFEQMSKTRDALLSLQQRIFQEIRQAFREATDRLHPGIDSAVRQLTMYALSPSENKRTLSGINLDAYLHLPLSRMVPMVARIAKNGNFYANL